MALRDFREAPRRSISAQRMLQLILKSPLLGSVLLSGEGNTFSFKGANSGLCEAQSVRDPDHDARVLGLILMVY
jgi:hypothetical protein